MYRILLVDDEILVRDAIKENIDWKSMDCQLVGDCENGKQAADFVKSHPVDIVLTDILMPYMDGMELSHFLNDNYPEIVIVIFSGFGEFEYAKKAIQYNVSEYMLKPVTAMELREVIGKMKEKVDQQIKEGEQTSNVKATYTVKVYVDADGDMVIVQNPTLAPAVEKSDYEPKTPEADASVDADTVNDATAFLETFFKLYPTATEKELAYYVLGNVIEPIGRDYLYSELVNPIFIKDGDNVKVKVAVKFIDNQTKATQVSQYELVLHKDSNWKIVG